MILIFTQLSASYLRHYIPEACGAHILVVGVTVHVHADKA